MEVFKSQVIYYYRLMIICEVSARKYPCRVQVITENFLHRLRNSTKTSVTMDDISAEIFTPDVQITKKDKKVHKRYCLYLYYITFV